MIPPLLPPLNQWVSALSYQERTLPIWDPLRPGPWVPGPSQALRATLGPPGPQKIDLGAPGLTKSCLEPPGDQIFTDFQLRSSILVDFIDFQNIFPIKVLYSNRLKSFFMNFSKSSLGCASFSGFKRFFF